MLKESISFCIFLLEWGLFLCFECCVVAIRQQHYWQAVSSCRGRFIVPVYLYSTCICNPFETHLCNVRNVFVICVLHIRRVKVWFLRCKSMVFGVQKGGFCIAKVWFLFFECCVVAICLECYHNLSATKWQSVRNVLAIRQQCFGNPSAAVGVRFIVPAYMKTPTK